jgi:hypothetical protein
MITIPTVQTIWLVVLGLLYLAVGALIIGGGEMMARWLAHKQKQSLGKMRRKIVLCCDAPLLLLLVVSAVTSIYFLLKPLI